MDNFPTLETTEIDAEVEEERVRDRERTCTVRKYHITMKERARDKEIGTVRKYHITMKERVRDREIDTVRKYHITMKERVRDKERPGTIIK